MAKHFSISRWNLTGKLFVSSLTGSASAKEAEEQAREKAERYGDQTFSHTVAADNFNQAQEVLNAQRLCREA